MNLHLGDAFDWLCGLPDKSVDLVITDPPYDSMEKYRAHSASPGSTCRLAKTRQSSSAWFPTVSNEYLGACLHQFARVLKPGAHCYVMANHETAFSLRPNWPGGLPWHKPLVWDKQVIGMGYHYRARYEFIIFASAQGASRHLNDRGIGDVLSVKALRSGRGPAYYPTEKPVELMEILVYQSSRVGEVVCDPFFGSGSVAMACRRNGREFIGCDSSPDAHAYLAERVAKADAQQELF